MGSTCLQSLRILNLVVGNPLTTLTPTNLLLEGVPFSLRFVVFPSKILIHLQKLSPKPKISRVFWMNLKDTESKAFSKSTRTARQVFFCSNCLFYCVMAIYSGSRYKSVRDVGFMVGAKDSV